MKNQCLVMGAATLAMFVTGCSSADEKPRRGKYKPDVALTALELPGMTPAMKQQVEGQMKAGFASQVGGEQCIGATKKDEWKNLSSEISKGMGGECKTVREASTNTSIDTEISCSGPQVGDMTVTIKGAAESESFSMDINMDMKNMMGRGPGKIGMKISAKRTGDC